MPVKKIKKAIKKLPEHKPYFEVVAAILTIPVLITVILLNISSLSQNKLKVSPTQTPQPTVAPRIIIQDRSGNEIAVTATPNPLTPTSTLAPTSASCQKSIGPVSIQYPEDGQTVTDNPLCFIIQHDNTNYCSVVWSYRINNGPYSDYTSDAPCIYNMPNGPTEFDLRVQSTVSQDQTIITRKFTYEGNTSVSTTPSPTTSQ